MTKRLATLPTLWDEKSRFRRALLRVLLWVVMVVSLALSVLNFRAHGLDSIAVTEAIIVAYSALFLWRLPKTPYLHWWSTSLVIFISATVLHSIATTAMLNDGFYWLLLVPTTSLLLLGLLWGGLITCIVGVMGVAVLVWVQPPGGGNATVAVGINAGLTYAFLWALSHVYESRRHQMVARLQIVAAQDPLTGLYNRLYLEDAFAQLCQSQPQHAFTLVLLDIDHFKQINDSHGHEVGDQVLRLLSQMLRSATREQDWVFRVGGEEFCLLLPGCNTQSAMDVAQKLRRAAADLTLMAEGQPVSFTVSIGLAQWLKDGDDFDSLYRQADIRLYQAKEQGRNTVVADQA